MCDRAAPCHGDAWVLVAKRVAAGAAPPTVDVLREVAAQMKPLI
jgi:hypothetical protein